MIYPRVIRPAIERSLFHGKAVVIYGARQVGKTTLLHSILADAADSLYLNCDEPDVRSALSDRTSTELRTLVGRHSLVAIDEAQRVRNIGLTLKLLVDSVPEVQVIATGSSSFELSNTIAEPLTGRKVEFHLFPLSVEELAGQESALDSKRMLEQRLRFGAYPEVLSSDDPGATIQEIATSYLYRDVLEYQTVRNPELLRRLLQALALQTGGEVSFNELAQLVGIDRATVQRYVSLLEQAYVIFRLPPFSRNLRKEIGKLRKIYFYDLGIRNAVINNFNPIEIRQDTGALWENYVISERVKLNQNHRRSVNTYFWRTYDGAEIDYLEEAGGKLVGLECKWSPGRTRVPRTFTAAYPKATVSTVHRDNYLDYLLPS